MLSALGLRICRVCTRWLPDPFVIAVLLTVVTALLALTLGDFPKEATQPSLAARLTALLDAWRSQDGFWKFLAFSMQMCLVLVTGHALAASRPVKHLLDRLAALPRTTGQGAALIAFAGCFASLINWGLGLILGAILAREVGRSMHRRGIRAHYPLLVAAGFAGFMTWHGGLSGSAPLTMTTPAGMKRVLPQPTIDQMSAAGFGEGIPLDRTLFSPLNAVVTLGLLAIVPLVAARLAPKRDADIVPVADLAPGVLSTPDVPSQSRASSPADWLDTARIVSLLLVIPLVIAVSRFVGQQGWLRFGLDEVNMSMIALGLILHGSPRSYLAALDEAARGCAGVILQFPLYGGILAMLVASGLDKQMASLLVASAGSGSAPIFVFLTACVVNMFIPSGGGQWGVQGPIALDAALRLDVDPGKMVMAVAYGDQITNMLQVFWALPLLAITGAKARDIIGYTAIIMLFGGAWVLLGLAVF